MMTISESPPLSGLLVLTDLREFAACQGLRENASVYQALSVPLGRFLCFPSPENPVMISIAKTDI